MRSNNVLDLLKQQSIVIPGSLLVYYKKLNINEKELIFLSYLMNKEEVSIFDVNAISKKINFEVTDIMAIVSSLVDKKIINVVIEKNKSGMMMEYLDISNLSLKLLSFILEEEKTIDTNVYEVIEKEFGRTLSPIEYETIKGWLDSGLQESLIKEALKESTLNGVSNLKYIDKILYEWNKRGFKKPSDIKRRREQKEEKIDVYDDYDWLNDNE